MKYGSILFSTRIIYQTPHWFGISALLLLLALLVVAGGWALYARALRVDRLHRQVLGTRATLEAQLALRAQAAIELAATGILDPASALLISRAAHQALQLSNEPLVDDGLDPAGAADVQNNAADFKQITRMQAESDLSRVLRTIISARVRAQFAQDLYAQETLDRLDRAAYRLTLARNFHNTQVTQARALRSTWIVKLFHLGGHAPLPNVFDIDDVTKSKTNSY